MMTKMGARTPFTPIVASGERSPGTTSARPSDQSVYIVLMIRALDYYTSDITRTWPVSGTFTPEQEKMYRCILEARDAIIAAMKPGVTIRQMQDAAEAVYKKHGFLQQFMELNRYVGHPVGLSVHDVMPGGMSASVLEPGVVFNVEPLLEFRTRR